MKLSLAERILRSKATASNCWLWHGATNKAGYGIVKVGGKVQLAHRAVFVALGGQIPDGMFLLHRCDVRDCVNPAHLFIGTNADNMADMSAKGRGRTGPRKGVDNPNVVLTPEKVLAIRHACQSFSQREVA